MIINKQAIFWCSIILSVVIFIALFHAISLPFILGFILAYLLNPAVEKLCTKFKIDRITSTILVMMATLFMTVLFFWLFVPILLVQSFSLVNNIPASIHHLDVMLNDYFGQQVSDFIEVNKEGHTGHLTPILKEALGWSGTVAVQVFKGSMTIVNIITFAIIAPIVAFYLLIDWERMLNTLDSWLPRHHAHTLRALIYRIDKTESAFIRGQSLVCIMQAVYYCIAFTVIGLDYAFIIGLTTGIVTFIPYVGASLGFLLAIMVGLGQFPDAFSIFMIVSIVYIVGQLLEGYVWIPKLIGESVDLHAIWIIFALMAFGSLFGLMGMLVAVPVTAALGVLCRFAIEKYKESVYYLGEQE